jgi:CDP-diglyceride synthetase
VLLLRALCLIGVANGTPVLMQRVLGARWAWPLDGGCRFIDGRPLFGNSKTLRGVVLSVLATTAAAPLLDLPVELGALVGVLAMAGDLISSFVKRRLGLAPSRQAIGLDQIPESLLPMLGCRALVPLDFDEIALGTVIFLVGELVLSRLFYRLNLRERPY